MNDLKEAIERLYALPVDQIQHYEGSTVFGELRHALNLGEVRAAEPNGSGGWRVNQWVKKGILLGFRVGTLADLSTGGFHFFDKWNLPLRGLTLQDKVRI